MKTGQKILVLSYFANEDTVAASHHIDDRLDCMLEMGLKPLLLSSICVPGRQDLPHFRIPSLSPSGLRFELRHILKKRLQGKKQWRLWRNLILLPILPLYALEKLFLNLDTTWYWYLPALLRGWMLCRRHQAALIYSTGGPPVAHLVAERLQGWTGIRWIAEIQDPLIHGYCTRDARERKLLLHTERVLCTKPERMVFLTRAAQQATETRAGVQGRGIVVYPGAKSRMLLKRKQDDRHLVLAHFGSLGGVRNLKTMIEGVEEAIRRQPGMAVQIRLYGNLGRDDRERIAASPAGELFVKQGLVARHEAMEAMGDCDILLLIQGVHDISAETIPSKVYEYLHCRRLVLGLVHQNPELAAMLEDLGHCAVMADAPKKLATELARLYKAWKNDELPRPEPSPYTVRRALEQLLAP